MNKDGSMARLPELIKLAKKLNLKIISIEDLVAYRMKNDSLIELTDNFEFKSIYGAYNLNVFKEIGLGLLGVAIIITLFFLFLGFRTSIYTYFI